MLFFLLSCFSFILISKSISHKPPPPWKGEIRLLAPSFWEDLSSFLVSWFKRSRLAISSFQAPAFMPLERTTVSAEVENVEEEERFSLLDLPELALELIFEQLSPSGLSNMAGVCTTLRDRCRSNHLWKKHMKQKWGRVIGDAAYKEWQFHLASTKRRSLLDQNKPKGLYGSLLGIWPLSLATQDPKMYEDPEISLPFDSIKAWYMSLQSGKFWFPAQVFNRENGHVGFMLSCYDANLSYDSHTDSFRARYSAHGRQTEESVQWNRLRAPPVDTPAHVLHESDCLHDLRPGDHAEIQWRRNREFPYGWWYGVVGHLESCDLNERNCHCHCSDKVILEFNQYNVGSRWRRTVLNRKDHQEEGNEVDGFYGGIRKLYKDEEISRWKCLWPTQVLE